MHIALAGWCQPSDLRDLLDSAGSMTLDRIEGHRAVPVSDLARSLVVHGHQVTLVTTSLTVPGETAEFWGPDFRLVVQRARPRPRHYLSDLYAVERRGISGVLRDLAPDVVHAHWTYEFELAAQDSGLPHVTTAHDSPFTILRHVRDPYRAARLGVALRARPGIRHLSAVSPYLADRWRRQMQYRRPISVIPNSIPQSAVSPSRTPSPHPTVLEVADSGRLKNISGLLRAFLLVRLHVPEAELRLVGPGLGALEPLASWASDQGMASGVSFLGPLGRAQLAEEYSRAWLFAHASLEESFGLTVLEALASGLPVVGGRDSGGVPFVLDCGRAGWLADVSDTDSLSRTILRLISDGPPSPPKGAAEYARATFGSASVMADYLEFYERALHPEVRRGTASGR